MELSSVFFETQLIRSDHSDIYAEQLKSFISVLSTERACGQGQEAAIIETSGHERHFIDLILIYTLLFFCMVLESWSGAVLTPNGQHL